MQDCETTSLLPCPFCGGRPQVLIEREAIYYVWCEQCGVSTRRSNNEDEAKAWWNVRDNEH